MHFTVTGRSTTGAIVFQYASLLNALSQAIGLSASGLAEVCIADGSGSAQTPADLYGAMFGGDAGNASRPTGVSRVYPSRRNISPFRLADRIVER